MTAEQLIQSALESKRDWEEVKEDIQGDLIRLEIEVKGRFPTLGEETEGSPRFREAWGFCFGWIVRSIEVLHDQEASAAMKEDGLL
jgi:hypothetical protein